MVNCNFSYWFRLNRIALHGCQKTVFSFSIMLILLSPFTFRSVIFAAEETVQDETPPPAESPTEEPNPAEEEPAPHWEQAPTLPPPADLAELRAIQEKVGELAERLSPAVVGIRIGTECGSGVIVSSDGLILTAGHVMRNPNQDARISLPDGRTVDAKTLGRCPWADAGMARITEEGEWPFAEVGRSKDLQRGTWCMAMGHPLGYRADRPPVVRVGRILLPDSEMLHSDAPIVAGDSGGPLFDLEGRVIGINSRISPNVNYNFHVAIDVFHENWDVMLAGKIHNDELPPGRDSHDVRSVFRPSTEGTADCVVQIFSGEEQVGLGTIVGPDGWILAISEHLPEGNIECRRRGGNVWEADLVGVDPEYGLAMLKVEATGLPAIDWSDPSNVEDVNVGQWVSTLGPDHDLTFALGVVSIPRRAIPRTRGVLGVELEPTEEGAAKIKEVVANSPASEVDIQAGDIITHINGETVEAPDQVVETVKQHRIGETIRVGLLRGEEVRELEVELGEIQTPATRKRDMQNESNIGLSVRRDDFPVVLQHDGAVRPEHCGTPIVNLDGKTLGVNIARAGRVETYAIPTDVLLPRLYELMSGRLPPPAPEPPPVAEPEPESTSEAEAAPEQDSGETPEQAAEPNPEPEPGVVPESESEDEQREELPPVKSETAPSEKSDEEQDAEPEGPADPENKAPSEETPSPQSNE